MTLPSNKIQNTETEMVNGMYMFKSSPGNPMHNKGLKPTRPKNGKKKAKKEGSEGYQEN